MDRTVPLAAARLLDVIRDTEVGTDGPAGYGTVYGHNQNRLPEPLTRMTIDEVTGAQTGWTRRFGSSAAGGYQFMRETLAGLKRELGLRGTQLLDPDLQDRLAFHLLKRRGYEAFMAGEIGRAEFGKRLAQEWASFPVLVEAKGARRQVARGQSYYAGDGLNRALARPEEVEAVLEEMLAIGAAMPAPIALPEAKPETGPETACETSLEEPASVPAAPAGQEGGPAPLAREPAARGDLTPLEQMNKPVQGAKAGLGASTFGGAVVLLLASAGWLPPAWSSGEAAIALGLVAGAISNQVGAFVGAYLARDKRFQREARA